MSAQQVIDNKKNWIKERLRYIDKTYWIIFGLLMIVSVIALFTASSSLAFKNGTVLGPVMSHIKFLFFGAICAFGIQLAPSKWVRYGGYVLCAISFILLLLTFTPLGVSRNDAARWIRLFGVEFQPSELAKISLIITASGLLSKIKSPQDTKKYFFITLGVTALICAPIFPSNFSTTVMLGFIIFLMFFLARVPAKYWLTTIGVVFVLLISGYFYVEKAYIEPQKSIDSNSKMKRVVTWCGRIDDLITEIKTPDEQFKLTDENYQRTLSKVAVARGGTSPVGVLPGNSTLRSRLPQAFADYIFAIIVEETGIVGAIGLIFLYLAFLFRACYTSSRYSDYQAMLMVMGLALMITFQALVSMLVVVGIGPVTGQPLPLISRGGTSTLVTCVYFGIIMCVAREQNELRAKQTAATAESREDAPEIILD